MAELWVDTERARSFATEFAVRGDAVARLQSAVETDLAELALGSVHSPAVQFLAAAATELWVDSAHLRLIVEAAATADGLAGADSAALRATAGARVRELVFDVCLAPGVPPTFSSAFGDLGGTGSAELRSPFATFGATSIERGRSALARLLADTASSTQLREDEFGLVELTPDRYVVVLPGVIDLSSPHFGLDTSSRSVRDLDQHAYPSSRSTSVDDNAYARAVWDALAANGVPTGAELMIVGHSFGADTALDLAADADFNGPSGYRVTHVVAAGYWSNPQLGHVVPETEVLVLQNHRDAAVIGEAIGHGPVTGTVDDAREAWDLLHTGDLVGAWSSATSAATNGATVVWNGATYTVTNSDELVAAGDDLLRLDLDGAGASLADFVTLDPHIEEVSPGHVIDVFEGGADGVGHHPSNYIHHVRTVDDELVVAFLESVDGAGFTAAGTTWAIDVSVP